MKNCKRLKNLPSINRKLESLECLDLSGCSSLTNFPEISWNLKELLLNETAIEELSPSIKFLDKIISLKLQNCTRLKDLPSGICELKSLEFLDLSGCSNLTKFEEIPGNVENIYLGGTAIEQLPSSIGCLSKLVLLDLTNCTRLEDLPITMCNLKSLQELILSGCTKFASYPEISKPMECLKNLYLDGTTIKMLPESIKHLSGLSSLELRNCKNLESLPDSTCKLKFLENLNLCGCSRLVKFPDNLGSLESLKVLKASGCKGQDAVGLLLPRLQGLSSLEILHLSDCNLRDFPHDVIRMSSLKELDLSQNKFQSIPADLKECPAVKFLHLSYCQSFPCLPELPSDLMKLDVHGCTALEEVSNIKLPMSYSSNGDHFIFTNCFKLNQNARRNIVASALERIQKMASLLGSQPCGVFCFPGVSIPKWFDHENVGSSVTVQLPQHLVQFALCAVIEFEDYSDDGDFKIRCEVINNDGSSHQTYNLKGWSGQKGKPRSVTSDHVFMWYDSSLTLDKVEGDNWYSQDSREVSIRVVPVDQDDKLLQYCCKVKMCGVRIFSDIGVNIAAPKQTLSLGKRNEGGSDRPGNRSKRIFHFEGDGDRLQPMHAVGDMNMDFVEDGILGEGVNRQESGWFSLAEINDRLYSKVSKSVQAQLIKGSNMGLLTEPAQSHQGTSLDSWYVNMDMGNSESIPQGTCLKRGVAQSSLQAMDRVEAKGKRVREM